jgi:hypothetical protein
MALIQHHQGQQAGIQQKTLQRTQEEAYAVGARRPRISVHTFISAQKPLLRGQTGCSREVCATYTADLCYAEVGFNTIMYYVLEWAAADMLGGCCPGPHLRGRFEGMNGAYAGRLAGVSRGRRVCEVKMVQNTLKWVSGSKPFLM